MARKRRSNRPAKSRLPYYKRDKKNRWLKVTSKGARFSKPPRGNWRDSEGRLNPPLREKRKARIVKGDARHFRIVHKILERVTGKTWKVRKFDVGEGVWSQGWKYSTRARVLYPDFLVAYNAIRLDKRLRRHFAKRRTLIQIGYLDPDIPIESRRDREAQEITIAFAEEWPIAWDQGRVNSWTGIEALAERYENSRVRFLEIWVQ